MRTNWTLALVLAVGVGLGAWLATSASPKAAAQGAAVGAVARYTVVETDATNLLVVDNSSNSLFYYTVNPGEKPGADMHLRGSLDLTKVGEAVLKPKKHNVPEEK